MNDLDELRLAGRKMHAFSGLERAVGLHDEHIDKQQYLTTLFAIPAIVIYILALKDKRKNYYEGYMTYGQGFFQG